MHFYITCFKHRSLTNVKRKGGCKKINDNNFEAVKEMIKDISSKKIIFFVPIQP